MVPMTVTKMPIVKTQRVNLLVVANKASQEMDVYAQVKHSYPLSSLLLLGACLSLSTKKGKKSSIDNFV